MVEMYLFNYMYILCTVQQHVYFVYFVIKTMIMIELPRARPISRHGLTFRLWFERGGGGVPAPEVWIDPG
jgi:hypothetical protein